MVSHTTATSQGNLEDSQERQYGKLGEVAYEKQTVVTYTSPLSPSVFETKYAFDTFGRLQRLTYPDGEVLTNTYDCGGNLQSTQSEKNGYRYRYLLALHYDKFEQRIQMEQGNGVKTAYAYDPKTRRLHQLTAGKGTLFQNLHYGYDQVGNILTLQNQVPVPTPNQYGGPAQPEAFTYDELYRLTSAQGSFQYAPDKTHTYTLTMGYDTIHNITTKNQLHTIVQPSQQAITQKKTSYDFTYTYNPSGPASTRPHAPVKITGRTYSHDPNGNQTGWTHDQNGTQRTLTWDEENRLQTLSDQGHTQQYKYDADGPKNHQARPPGRDRLRQPVLHPKTRRHRHQARLRRHHEDRQQAPEAGHPNANPQGKTPLTRRTSTSTTPTTSAAAATSPTSTASSTSTSSTSRSASSGWNRTATSRTPYLFTAKELDEETNCITSGRGITIEDMCGRIRRFIDRFRSNCRRIWLETLPEYSLFNPLR